MSDPGPTPPPSSSRISFSAPLGQYRQLRAHLRAYDQDPGIEQVWRRLEVSRSGRRTAPVGKVLRSAALVAAGVLLGMWINSGKEPARLVTAESQHSNQVVPSAPRRATSELRDGSSADDTSEQVRTQRPEREARYAMARRRLAHPRVPLPEEVDDPAELEANGELPELGPEPILPPVRPRWLLLADSGDFAGAFQQLDESDGFAEVLQTGSADDLMTLADVARAMGRQGRAVQALRRVIEWHQSDPNAPLAAMSLGNLLSRAGDESGAAEAFALNRRLAPGGDFAEDALVREFDMAVIGSDLQGAIALADQYDLEFPGGQHQEHLRAEIARLAEGLVAKSSADAAGEGETDGETGRVAKSDSKRPRSERAPSPGNDPSSSGRSAEDSTATGDQVRARSGEERPRSPSPPSTDEFSEGSKSALPDQDEASGTEQEGDVR